MPNLGQIRRFLEPCDLEIWRMTLKNDRAPLLSIIKLYASFPHHMWIQTGVTVRKRLSWVVTSVTLTFDLWPLPLAWTSLLSLVTTPENFMMIRWWEHSQKGVTDGRTDGQTDRQTDRQTENTIHRAAWSQLKITFTVNAVGYVSFLVGDSRIAMQMNTRPLLVNIVDCEKSRQSLKVPSIGANKLADENKIK